MLGVEFQTYVTFGVVSTNVLALAADAKSPPALVHGMLSKNRCVQVAAVPSLGVANPWPPFTVPKPTVPSPQSASSRCNPIGLAANSLGDAWARTRRSWT